MLKTFFLGLLLGLAAAAGILYSFPAVDQVREASIVAVAPNGGNSEEFHINLPMDRVMMGASGNANFYPPALSWPAEELPAGMRTELFKIRNARNDVVGVAARAAVENGSDHVIDWVLHLPARGSMFFNLDAVPREGGFRMGELRSGSREFANLSGFLTEHWAANSSNEEDAPDGRIELRTTYVGQLEPLRVGEVSE